MLRLTLQEPAFGPVKERAWPAVTNDAPSAGSSDYPSDPNPSDAAPNVARLVTNSRTLEIRPSSVM